MVILWGPFLAYKLPSLPLTLGELEVIPDGVDTTPESDEWAGAVIADLAPHGFVPRRRFRARGNGQIHFAQRLDNPNTGEVANIMAGWRPTLEGPAPLRLVVFHTRVRDGDVLTSDATNASITPRLPGQRICRLPGLDGPTLLYGLHRRLVREDGRTPVPLVLGEDPLGWERQQHERSLATHLAHGLAVRDESIGRLRSTLKGAFRNTWLLHPNLAGLHDRRAMKEAQAALAATLRAAPA